MLKVFLVEDESIMREGLRDNMPWQQYGYEFVGEASDGEMALPLIRKTRPDVLITDIKMPFMDGLMLSRIVSKEFPAMKIIILSGYDDFDYARQAIEIGVKQYILKPVTREKMKKVLIEIKEKIESEREKNQYLEQFNKEMQEYGQMAQRRFFEKVFSGQFPVQDIYAEMEKLSLELDGPCFNLVMVMVEKKHKESTPQTDSIVMLRCQEEMLYYFMKYQEYLVFYWNINTYGILIKGEEETVRNYTHRAIQNIVRIYSQAEGEYDWYTASGEPVMRLSQLAECYEQVNQKLSLRHLMPEQHVITEIQNETMLQDEKENLARFDAAKVNPDILNHFFDYGTEDEIDNFVQNYLHTIKDGLQSKLFRNYLLLNVRFSSIAYAEKLGCSQEEFLKKAGADNIPEDIQNLDLISDYFKRLVRQVILEREKENTDRSHTILAGALEYIEKHYEQENLSLNEAAAVINVSPNYFSAMFSQEMNMTFIEYVTNKRMEKAKKLLRNSNMSTAEIAAQTGYKDAHYFSFVFKKTQGCTPREYRNQSSS